VTFVIKAYLAPAITTIGSQQSTGTVQAINASAQHAHCLKLKRNMQKDALQIFYFN